MPAPKSLEKYPAEFFPLAEQAFRQAKQVSFGTGAPAFKQAVRVRQLFYAWRDILQSVGHPTAFQAKHIQVRMERTPTPAGEEITLIFENASNSAITKALKAALGEALPPLPPAGEASAEVQQGLAALTFEEDPNEAALRSLGMFDGVERREAEEAQRKLEKLKKGDYKDEH